VTSGRWFKDRRGRVMLLRGVNLSGSSKVPARPPLPTHVREGFFDGATVSFVGRPFPLEQADEHLARLRAWGFRFLRLLTTWESIEHAGPGIYDTEYLDYLHEVARKAGEHGLDVFLDPHQDMWSRFSGGDGAPLWTFEKVGLDVSRFHATGAAIVHNTHGDPFPQMVWPTNAGKYATATMFTLFFGGDTFAPGMTIDGVPVQEYLQSHYVDALRQAALRLRDLPNVVGVDTLNEPVPGYIGVADLTGRWQLTLGASPSYFQGMALASGVPQDVPDIALGMTGFKEVGRRQLNAERATAFRAGVSCPWRTRGVWDLDQQGAPVLLRPDYFARVNGQPVDFLRDHYKPFLLRVASMLRQVDPTYIVFVEPPMSMAPPHFEPAETEGFAFAPHWYDGVTLITKRSTGAFTFDITKGRPVFGVANVKRLFAAQVGGLVHEGDERLGGRPTLIGEFGIPMDMNGRKAYASGDFSDQTSALERSMQALEKHLVSYTLWNYTPDNTNERGDLWNGEDLSIWSRDQQNDPRDLNSGGRALGAAVRPHPYAIAGTPLRSFFHAKTRTFVLEFQHEGRANGPTEIFVPRLQYPDGFRVFVSDGEVERVEGEDVILYRHTEGVKRHVVVVR
jgi:hypothetical protein